MSSPDNGVAPLAEILDWDSDFWGLRVARVATPSDLHDLHAAVHWCAEHRVRMAHLSVAAGRLDLVDAAVRSGFDLVDVRVELRRSTDPRATTADAEVRDAQASDIAVVGDIASAAHRGTRFSVDRHFPPGRSDELYRTWIENSIDGWADFVLVVDDGSGPTGYVTGHVDADRGTGSIGLIAIAATARGAGRGRVLVEAALDRFESAGASNVSVATQASNVAALRLYERSGFVTHDVSIGLHKWFESPRPERAERARRDR
jgi:dTDP-4-amino-4,6-dideoxy-D-galactose acyltransferase